MKAIIQAYSPAELERIARGEQTIKVCKTAPKETPFKVYIYQTKKRWLYKILPSLKDRQAKVIGEFICDKVIKTCGWRLRGNTGWCAKRTEAEEKFPTSACLTIDEIVEYAGGEGCGVSGWHISDLKIYDKPKELSDFNKPCVDKYQYCQGWRYGSIILSADEEEYALYHGGRYEYFDTACHNYVSCPPRNWRYVEELEE